MDSLAGDTVDYDTLLLQTLRLADGSMLDNGDAFRAGVVVSGGVGFA
jgi:hypothetical protein